MPACNRCPIMIDRTWCQYEQCHSIGRVLCLVLAKIHLASWASTMRIPDFFQLIWKPCDRLAFEKCRLVKIFPFFWQWMGAFFHAGLGNTANLAMATKITSHYHAWWWKWWARRWLKWSPAIGIHSLMCRRVGVFLHLVWIPAVNVVSPLFKHYMQICANSSFYGFSFYVAF